MDQANDPEITTEELLGWMEFGCWAALVMAPLIYWLQGPSVSTDQYVVRTILVIVAAAGGVGLRLRAVLIRRRARGCRAGDAPPQPPSGESTTPASCEGRIPPN